MGQRFYASASDTFAFPNGAIGHRTGGGSFDCLGPYAKVRKCPIQGMSDRLTCYATGYHDTFFSVPACTRYRGRYVSGFFALNNGGAICFVPHNRHAARLNMRRYVVRYHTRFSTYVYEHECYATDAARAVIMACAANPDCVIISATADPG